MSVVAAASRWVGVAREARRLAATRRSCFAVRFLIACFLQLMLAGCTAVGGNASEARVTLAAAFDHRQTRNQRLHPTRRGFDRPRSTTRGLLAERLEYRASGAGRRPRPGVEGLCVCRPSCEPL